MFICVCCKYGRHGAESSNCGRSGSEEEEEGLGFVLFAENKRTEMYHGAMGVVELPCKHGHAYGEDGLFH